MKPWSRSPGSSAADALRRGLTILLCALLFLPGGLLGAAPAQLQIVGSLEVRGAVSINNQPAVSGTTVFVGDTIRTGADGAASVMVAGRGMLIVAAETELTLSAQPRFLAILDRGTLGLRAQADARGFSIRVGNFVVVPSPEAEATAEIERAADGSAQVRCTAGSVGVIALEGEETVFLQPGQGANISAAGRLTRAVPPQPAPTVPAPTPPPPQGKHVPVGVWVAVAGAGAAGAAIALSRGKKGATLSPVQP